MNAKYKNSEFANVYKYIQPNFNPGVRQWRSVKPERHVVTGLDGETPNFIPPNAPPYTSPPNLYRCPYDDKGMGLGGMRIGNVGDNFAMNFGRNVMFDRRSLIKILIIVIVVSMLWRYLKKDKFLE
uniref:Uncharacterized protein n=1 Tax=Mimivirus LCMiAC01 TaxID=2506608 RepID=A0A481YZ72_9VIRU|nr:MAG: hypothetical protein LCMiAC01_02290 [Mimivirus LCMiAC01]